MKEKLIKFYKKYNLRNRQRKINKKYAEEGLTDEILNEQVKINKERHEYDIVDETELDTLDEFVQWISML